VKRCATALHVCTSKHETIEHVTYLGCSNTTIYPPRTDHRNGHTPAW